MQAAILVLNAGSSSLKFGLYEIGSLSPLLRGGIADIGEEPALKASGELQDQFSSAFDEKALAKADHSGLIEWLLATISGRWPGLVAAVGHRIVHGGISFADSALIGSDVMARIAGLVPLAPVHQSYNLAGIHAVERIWPDIAQVACFDTAFHATQPRLAQLFALPRELAQDGIIRYGFHGLSYAYIASVLPSIAGKRAEERVIVAHLGQGASLCALWKGRSVATTMGFTALDGLVMGTRCGTLDPGVILHLLRTKQLSADEIEDLLYNRSGLKGVSGISDDVRRLETNDDPRATEALELFAYRAAREIGSLAAALGGLDVLVFTGGIGEHSARVRRSICGLCDWLGLKLDGPANDRHMQRLHAGNSAVDVFAIPTNEEIVIARETARLTANRGQAG